MVLAQVGRGDLGGAVEELEFGAAEVHRENADFVGGVEALERFITFARYRMYPDHKPVRV